MVVISNKIAERKLKGSHDYSHLERLLKYARKLNSKYRGSWKVIKASILLHEITKDNPNNSRRFLNGFSKKEVEGIIYCIRSHYNFKKKPKTIEAKIVQDCDILDMLGAIGIARGFMRAGEKNLDLRKAKNEYKRKRLYVYDKLNLKESRNIANEKFKFTKLFFKTIDKEMVK